MTFYPNCQLTLLDAAAAVNSVKNAELTQTLANGTEYVLRCARNLADHTQIGPAATSVKNQAAATGNELSGLANSRQTPSYTAANGETLTREAHPLYISEKARLTADKTTTRSSTLC